MRQTFNLKMVLLYKLFRGLLGPYKSALIAAPLFYCRGAAIEERRSRIRLLRRSLVYCGAAIEFIFLLWLFSIAAAAMAAERLPKHGRKHRRSSRFIAAIEALLYDPLFRQELKTH